MARRWMVSMAALRLLPIKEELSRQLEEELTRTGDPRIQDRHEEVFYIPHHKNLEQRETR